MAEILQKGHRVVLASATTLADCLLGVMVFDNRYTFSLVNYFVVVFVLVSEERIWQELLWAFKNHGLVLEGAGAVGIAALMSDMIDPGARVAVVCSGQNIEPHHLKALSESRSQPS
jgi:threonine dehydratase